MDWWKRLPILVESVFPDCAKLFIYVCSYKNACSHINKLKLNTLSIGKITNESTIIPLLPKICLITIENKDIFKRYQNKIIIEIQKQCEQIMLIHMIN